jgi:hypothetical protein
VATTQSVISPPGRLCWVWPLRHSPALGRRLLAVAAMARPLCAGWRWVPSALAVGLGPLLLGYALGSAAHQAATAVLLVPLFLALVRDDRQGPALAALALVGGAHSALAIGLTVADPGGAVAVLPGGERYWRETLHWIRTGEDPEYVLANWLPAHALLLVGMVLFGYTSLGLIPFWKGLEQVDLMNYYVGRLLSQSQDAGLAVLVGWHLWSLLRGLAYAVLVYEVASLSLERLSGQPLSTGQRRRVRWAVGLGLCVADGVVKYMLLGPVRGLLHANLLPEAL